MKQSSIRYDPKNDYYKRLGVSPSATAEEIQRVYRQKAKTLHPDVNPSQKATELFQQLNEAYNVLGNPQHRAAYDRDRDDYVGAWGGGTRSARSTTRTYSRRSRQDEWWNIPHQPSQSRTRSTQSRPYTYARPAPPPTDPPGNWLKAYGLGSLQPLYASVVGLITSPYRYILIILSVVLMLNIIYIITQLTPADTDLEPTTSPEPTTSLAQVTEQLTHLEANTPIPYQPCESDYQLNIQDVRFSDTTARITATPRQGNLSVFVAGVVAVDVLEAGNAFRPRAASYEATIQFNSFDRDARPTTLQTPLTLQGSQDEGAYVLRWFPTTNDTPPDLMCDQLLYLVSPSTGQSRQ